MSPRVRARSRRDLALAFVLVVLGLGLAHGDRLIRNLPRHHWEDWRFFRHSRLEIHTPVDCFTKPSVWPGLYRPLSTNCYYLLGRMLFGNRVEAYHLVNLAVFAGNALLLFAIARRLLPPPWPLLPPLFFVTRLAHVQVLLYTSEMQVLLATLFSLAALALWQEARARASSALEAASLVAFALALLSKESAVSLAAVATAYGLLFDRASGLRRYLRWWAVAAAWVALYVVADRWVGGGQPTGFVYDVSWRMWPRVVACFLAFFNWIVRPVDDVAMVPRVPLLASSVAVQAALAVVAVHTAAVLYACRRSAGAPGTTGLRVLAFGFAWFLAGTAPFAILADRLFLRTTYFGHAGLALALAGVCPMALEWLGWRRLPPASRQQDA